MKLLTLFVITILFLSLDRIHSTTTQLKSKTEKAESMFELLEQYSNDKYENQNSGESEANYKAEAGPKKKKRGRQNKKSRTKIAVPDPNVLLHEDKELDIVHQGWLQVSNPNLKNLDRYSQVNLPNWEENKIPTGFNFFRKNKAYQSGGTRDSNSPPAADYFYVRLSKRNIFYSPTKDSVITFGSMATSEIITAKILKEYARLDTCFEIVDRKRLRETFCARTVDERNKWVCKIKELLRQEDFLSCSKSALTGDLPKVVKKILQPIIMLPYASPMCNENYNYDAYGMDWECDCREGMFL